MIAWNKLPPGARVKKFSGPRGPVYLYVTAGGEEEITGADSVSARDVLNNLATQYAKRMRRNKRNGLK